LTATKAALLPVLLALAAPSVSGAQAPPDLAAVGVVVGATPERSVVILQSGGRSRSAGLGDTAFGGRVTAVSREGVTLDFDGRAVDLRLTTGRGVSSATRPAGPATEVAGGPPPGEAMGWSPEGTPARKILSRADVERRLTEEMPRLMQAALRPVTEDGRIVGMQVSKVPGGSLLQEVGIQSGDVLTRLNDVDVDGLPALMGLWSSLPSASEIDATVLRGGRPVSLGVSLR
jgi:general secretion pathway protein C